MTLIDSGDDVVYEIALNEHFHVAGEDDDRTDDELIRDVAERIETADDLDWPGLAVMVAEPETPEQERLRCVNTAKRINVLAPYSMGAHKHERDVFAAVAERIEVEGLDMGDMAMSYWTPTHPDDFDGPIHLDLTDGE